MLSNCINYQNFGAQYVASAKVKKLNPEDSRFHDEEVSFVELDTDNPNDLQTLYDLSLDWPSEKLVYGARVNFMNKINGFHSDPLLFKTYALTKQKDGFDELKSQEILGITQVHEYPGNLWIDRLVVDTMQQNESPFKEYKYVGTAILDTLKNLYSKDNAISLESMPNTTEFYEKNEFVEVPNNRWCYTYPRQGGGDSAEKGLE